MYADQVASERKLSVKDRLQGAARSGSVGVRQTTGFKRQRPEDSKWKHDLYTDLDAPQSSKPKLGVRDLRLKLQRKSSEQFSRERNPGGVRDLRERLSGAMHPPPSNVGTGSKPVKATAAAAGRMTKKDDASDDNDDAMPDVRKAPNPASATSKKKSLLKTEESIEKFLKSLALDKYTITFQAEEVDMDALLHMTDEDLRAIGIPMGPRKKIRLALDSRS